MAKCGDEEEPRPAESASFERPGPSRPAPVSLPRAFRVSNDQSPRGRPGFLRSPSWCDSAVNRRASGGRKSQGTPNFLHFSHSGLDSSHYTSGSAFMDLSAWRCLCTLTLRFLHVRQPFLDFLCDLLGRSPLSSGVTDRSPGTPPSNWTSFDGWPVSDMMVVRIRPSSARLLCVNSGDGCCSGEGSDGPEFSGRMRKVSA